MGQAMKLTQAAVTSFKMPKGKAEVIVFDDNMPGFGLRVRGAAGRKEHRTFIAQYKIGAKHRRVTLGNVSKVALDEARKKARAIFGKVADGKDPAGEKAVARKDAAHTLSTIAEDFISVQTPKLRPATLYATKLYLNEHLKPLHRLTLTSIDRATVAAQLREIAKQRGNVTADRARAALSAMFTWAMGEGLAEMNPVIGTNKAAGEYQSRDRVLTDAELVELWKATPESDFGWIIRLLLLTGQRRNEIGGLLRSEIDAESRLIALPGERTKNALPHDVPLSESAMAVLKAIPERANRDHVFGRGEGGFSGWSAAKAALDEELSFSDWTLHDLRRTWATRAADSGVQPHVIEAALNHVSGHRAGVAGTYNRATYAAEKRQAMEAVASYIKTAIAKAEGANVKRLKPKSA